MNLYEILFNAACAIGRPIGGIRPRRIYHWLARRAFHKPEFSWVVNRWGCRMFLSPFYLLDRQIIAFGSYDAPMHRFIEANVTPGMFCMDVGANIGEVTLHFSKLVGANGRVDSFEPAPAMLRRLRENVAGNDCSNVTVHGCAMSDKSGVLSLSIADEQNENQGMSSLVTKTSHVMVAQVDVPVRALDELRAESPIDRCDFIKVDIQGSELAFVRGAKDFLTRFKPLILMEVSSYDLVAAGTTPGQLAAALQEIGYHMHEMSGVKIGRIINENELVEGCVIDNVVFVPVKSQTPP